MSANILKIDLERIKKTIEKISKISIKKKRSTSHKKEIISKLKDRFQLDSIKPKQHIKHYSEDIKKLKKHGFKVMEHKKPQPMHVVPQSRTHTKHSIIKHFKEVYSK